MINENRFYVYVLLDPRKNNQPFYVGKGSKDRVKYHLGKNKAEQQNNPFKTRTIESIRKAGLEPIPTYWDTDLLEDEAFLIENALIKKYGRAGIDEGGILTNICLDARPPSCLGRQVSSETREKIAAAQRGELNHRYGKQWDEEQKELRRAYNLEHGIKPPVRSGPMSEDQKAAIGHGNRGKKRTAEMSARQSERQTGSTREPASDAKKLQLSISNALAKATPENRIKIEALVAEGKFDPVQWKKDRRSAWKKEQRALGRKVD